jgi:hypothetical protein
MTKPPHRTGQMSGLYPFLKAVVHEQRQGHDTLCARLLL